MHIFVSVKMTHFSEHCNGILEGMCAQTPSNYTCKPVGKVNHDTWFYYKPNTQVASTQHNEEAVRIQRNLFTRKLRQKLQGGASVGKTSLLNALAALAASTPRKIKALWRDATRRGLIDDGHSVRQLTHLIACVLRRNVALVYFVDHGARTIQSVTYMNVTPSSSYVMLYATTPTPTFKVLLDGDGEVSTFSKSQLEWVIDRYDGPKKHRVSSPPVACADATVATYALLFSRRE